MHSKQTYYFIIGKVYFVYYFYSIIFHFHSWKCIHLMQIIYQFDKWYIIFSCCTDQCDLCTLCWTFNNIFVIYNNYRKDSKTNYVECSNLKNVHLTVPRCISLLPLMILLTLNLLSRDQILFFFVVFSSYYLMLYC